MNFKRIVSLFVCVCIICSAVFTLVACKDKKSDAEPTESGVETESVSEDVETDSTGDKWVSEFVDTTVEDGSVVYKTTKKHVEGTESVAELAIHCFKNDVEQWVYKTQFTSGGGDGTNKIVFDDEKVYFAVCKYYLSTTEDIFSATIALDKETGKEVWSVNNTSFSDILLDDENVYLSCFQGVGLYILSKDGEIKAEYPEVCGNLYFVDENTLSLINDFNRYDVDVSAYKSKDTIPEKIYKCLPITVTASSTLAPGNGKTYDAKNLTDRDPATVWSEGEKGLGEGTTLTVDLGKSESLGAIYIRNGHHGSKELHQKNGKPKTIELNFNDGTEPQKITCNLNFVDGWDVIYIGTECSSFTIKILEAEAGTEYDDVCISDIEVYSAKLWTD